MVQEQRKKAKVRNPSTSNNGGYDFTKRWGNISQITAATVAILALAGAAYQVSEIRANSRETNARQIFRNYLELAFNNPKYSKPNYDALKKAGGDEYERYSWFVTNLLYACEEIGASFPKDEAWRSSCKDSLSSHARYLCDTSEQDDLSAYNLWLQNLVKEVMAKSRNDSSPECRDMKVS